MSRWRLLICDPGIGFRLMHDLKVCGATFVKIKSLEMSKMEAPIVKDGGSNYQRWRLQIWRLQIVNNLATNPPFFLPC